VRKLLNLGCAGLSACLLLSGVSSGANAQQPSSPAGQQASPSTSGAAPSDHANNGAQQLVNESVNVINKMKSDPKLAALMREAKGIYVVPKFGRGALIVGAHGGVGLVTIRNGSTWSDPAFFDLGAISIGAQAGGSGGPVAFLLMKDSAVNSFRTSNNFALNAHAGVSIVTYSGDAQASWGKGDIIMWSDNPGLYASANVSVSDVAWDADNNQAFYGDNVNMTKILNGTVQNAAAGPLKQALPS
jgi:SH3 domain-containing YSC84-like protein 1